MLVVVSGRSSSSSFGSGSISNCCGCCCNGSSSNSRKIVVVVVVVVVVITAAGLKVVEVVVYRYPPVLKLEKLSVTSKKNSHGDVTLTCGSLANPGTPQAEFSWRTPNGSVVPGTLIKNTKTELNLGKHPGADIGSDHAPVIMKINIKLKIPRRKSTKAAKYDVSQLKNEELQKKYAVGVKNRFECLMLENCTHEANEENVNNIWDSLKTAVTETNESMLPKAKRERKQAWMKEEILELMKERKKYKGTGKYKE
ncbi:craniofacial development protein 2 [Elysia marginata]|uniref:Craniofacial development protein 2 n=1 Tax=Elysia marginata TaxID=1093978 RepID=A0AAV4EYP9_9GAST|nr:craniofacial development protein 2 [Elysia marginata]